jgi:hypothetical protein
MIVTFNIADGSFEFFTYRQWATRLDQWREQLLNDGYEFALAYDEDEIVEYMYGEELFFDIVPDFVK